MKQYGWEKVSAKPADDKLGGWLMRQGEFLTAAAGKSD